MVHSRELSETTKFSILTRESHCLLQKSVPLLKAQLTMLNIIFLQSLRSYITYSLYYLTILSLLDYILSTNTITTMYNPAIKTL
jgi:hypothetical protein